MTTRERIRWSAVYGVVLLVFALLQSNWPVGLSPAGARPDLTLVVVMCAGYLFGARDGAVTGLAGGFLMDLQSGRLLGLAMLLLFLAGMLPSLVFRRLSRRPILLAPLAAALGAVVFHAALLGLTQAAVSLSDWADVRPEYWNMLFGRLLPIVITDSLIALPVAFLLRNAGPYRKPKPQEEWA